jgi:xanthine dehydrogenase YagS FAD-binding subunit
MKAFRYEAVTDASSAVTLLAADPSAKLLSGGTNLVDLMKLGVERPDALIDVTRLGLDDVEELDGGGLRIGAGVPNSVLAADHAVRQAFPVLSQALLAGASGQLRNMATTAGNLLQRTRCLYFQDIAKPCNKRAPGTGCPAIEGQHHNLAILGGSSCCIATHPSDMAVALAALDAVVHVQGRDGVRAIGLNDFYRLPGDTPEIESVLAHDEVITSVVVPALSYGAVSAYRKVRERASYAFAISSVAAAIDVQGGVIRDVRIALGAVAPKPWRALLAEAALVGQRATIENFEEAIGIELGQAQPLRDNAYKVELTQRVTVATLAQLAGVTG